MRFLIPVIMMCSIGFCTGAHAEDDSNIVSGFTYNGTLGNVRIGMNLLQQKGKVIAPSHYYYFKYLTDIPLTLSAGDDLTLAGSDGGVFHLKFKASADDNGEPLSAENSIGLMGTWTSKDGKTLPVTLELVSGYQKDSADQRQYANLTEKSDAEFEANPQGFYKAVMSGDREAAAKFVHFPLRFNVSAGKNISIKNPQMLNQYWDTMFNPAWMKAAAEAAPHDMSGSGGYICIGQGLVYFDDQGAFAINTVK